jgi:hypothetical protein
MYHQQWGKATLTIERDFMAPVLHIRSCTEYNYDPRITESSRMHKEDCMFSFLPCIEFRLFVNEPEAEERKIRYGEGVFSPK